MLRDSLSRYAAPPPPPPASPAAAPGSEMVRVSAWRCLACGDVWTARPDEGHLMEVVISLHQRCVHGDTPPPGRYHNRPLYVIRPPRSWIYAWGRSRRRPRRNPALKVVGAP